MIDNLSLVAQACDSSQRSCWIDDSKQKNVRAWPVCELWPYISGESHGCWCILVAAREMSADGWTLGLYTTHRAYYFLKRREKRERKRSEYGCALQGGTISTEIGFSEKPVNVSQTRNEFEYFQVNTEYEVHQYKDINMAIVAALTCFPWPPLPPARSVLQPPSLRSSEGENEADERKDI